MLELPFNPIKRAEQTEGVVMQGGERKYHRFRPAPYYGGIATADAVGCCFLCAYCWSYFRIIEPEKHGRFFSPQQVARNLLKIARSKGFKYVRITGCEPILGERSLGHLAEVIRKVQEENQDLTFILETNALLLGYYPDFIRKIKFPRVSIRVAIKGWDEEAFEQISGADRNYFEYPLIGLKKMLDEGMDAWPAVMGDVFGKEGIKKLKIKMQAMGLNCRIETEELERYPYVMENINKRGVTIK